MKKGITVFLLFLWGMASAQSEQLFKEANALYNSGKYEEAATKYLKILDGGVHSASLYYNLGNTYYKLNQVAPSIYYYEKALWLAPNDPDVQNNLQFAQNMTVDAIDSMPQGAIGKLFRRIAGLLPYNGWAIFGVIFMGLFVVGFLEYYFSVGQRQKRLFFIAGFGFLFLSLAGIVLAYNEYTRERKEKPAIVFVKETSVRSEPNYRSEEIFLLHEGTKVNVEDGLGDWKKIALADGKIGWLPADDIKEVKIP